MGISPVHILSGNKAAVDYLNQNFKGLPFVSVESIELIDTTSLINLSHIDVHKEVNGETIYEFYYIGEQYVRLQLYDKRGIKHYYDAEIPEGFQKNMIDELLIAELNAKEAKS